MTTIIEDRAPASLQLSRKDAVCRSCGEPLVDTFVDLGGSPLANSNLEPFQLNQMEPIYPLHAYVCRSCFLVQLEEFETPQHIFEDYVYLSSCSESWVKHAQRYVESITKRLNLGKHSQVMEIASNDGYLLQFFVETGIPALGIEPAANVALIANNKGIPTRVKFFGTRTAEELRSEGLASDLIIGNNVLAHVPDLNDFVAGLKIALAEKGVITMEFPHLLALMKERQFDTIYHEHFSYFSLLVASKVFTRHGLTIFDVEQLPTHGGSLRIYAAHAENGDCQITENVRKLMKQEVDYGLSDVETYRSFSEKVMETKRGLLKFLIEAKEAGKQVVGYGAPAKGNTLLNYCGVRADLLDYVVDINPLKQGRFLPGTRLPIFAPDKIFETKPDYLLLLPWNIREEIMDKMSGVRGWGCQFVTPLPAVRIYP